LNDIIIAGARQTYGLLSQLH